MADELEVVGEARKHPGLQALLWDKADIGLALVAEDGRWLDVNARLCEILEYTPAEMLGGMTFQDVTIPADVDADVRMTEALRDGELDHYRMRKTYLKKSRFPVAVDLVVWPVFHADGSFELFLSQIIPRIDVRGESPREIEVNAGQVMLQTLFANKGLVAKIGAAAIALMTAAAALVNRLVQLLG